MAWLGHRVVAAMAAGVVGGGTAMAQCTPEWQAVGAARGMNGVIHATTTWDPDGPGPQAEQVVAGGDFTVAGGVRANRVAHWDGTQWLPFGSGLTAIVRTLTTWDPDGPGPQHARLVAGGEFYIGIGRPNRGVAWWD